VHASVPKSLLAGLILAVASSITGCYSTPPPTQVRSMEERAIEVAKKYVLNNFAWKKIEVTRVSLIDGIWEIDIWWLPKTPGGFGTVKVSGDGEVLGFLPGL